MAGKIPQHSIRIRLKNAPGRRVPSSKIIQKGGLDPGSAWLTTQSMTKGQARSS
jgi:hypothetical protein